MLLACTGAGGSERSLRVLGASALAMLTKMAWVGETSGQSSGNLGQTNGNPRPSKPRATRANQTERATKANQSESNQGNQTRSNQEWTSQPRSGARMKPTASAVGNLKVRRQAPEGRKNRLNPTDSAHPPQCGFSRGMRRIPAGTSFARDAFPVLRCSW